MFYKAIGFVVWKLALAELRRRYQRRSRQVGVVGVLGLLAVGAFLATRSGGE